MNTMLLYKIAQQTLKTGVQDFIFSQCSTQIYLKFESYNLQSKTLVHKGVDFYVQNVLKLTHNYEHLLIPKIFPGIIPQTPLKGEAREGEEREREGRGEKGRGRVASCLLGEWTSLFIAA